VDETLELLGLSSLRHRTMVEVSTGEARRALLARALAPRPRVLLLDEFVNGLDAASRGLVLSTVADLARAGLPVVLATHRPEEVIPEARMAAILERGSIVAAGPREAIEQEWKARSAARPGPPPPFPARRPADPIFEVRGDVLVEGRRVLRGLDWRMRPGECWVVRGGNGAGKSTFLRLLLGEEHLAPGGRVTRLDLGSSPDVRDVRARVGLLSPEFQARHRGEATGIEVVLSGFAGSIGLGETPAPGQREAALRWMEVVGAAHLDSRDVQSISYGELRRLLLARALVTDPEVLLLDEPYSGLEPRARSEAMALVDRLCSGGRSVVLVTHHDDEVSPAFTHELRLRAGQVERAGPILAAPGHERARGQ
jgi:molybdate transport system ATP-binding protein